jgi:hypothetical protein
MHLQNFRLIDLKTAFTVFCLYSFKAKKKKISFNVTIHSIFTSTVFGREVREVLCREKPRRSGPMLWIGIFSATYLILGRTLHVSALSFFV